VNQYRAGLRVGDINEIFQGTALVSQYIYLLGMRWAGHVARMGKRRGVYRVSVGKPEGRRPLGRPRRRWDDNIKIDIQEFGCGGYGLDRAVLG
jgi:hypothetical protein